MLITSVMRHKLGSCSLSSNEMSIILEDIMKAGRERDICQPCVVHIMHFTYLQQSKDFMLTLIAFV